MCVLPWTTHVSFQPALLSYPALLLAKCERRLRSPPPTPLPSCVYQSSNLFMHFHLLVGAHPRWGARLGRGSDCVEGFLTFILRKPQLRKGVVQVSGFPEHPPRFPPYCFVKIQRGLAEPALSLPSGSPTEVKSLHGIAAWSSRPTS